VSRRGDPVTRGKVIFLLITPGEFRSRMQWKCGRGQLVPNAGFPKAAISVLWCTAGFGPPPANFLHKRKVKPADFNFQHFHASFLFHKRRQNTGQMSLFARSCGRVGMAHRVQKP